MDDKGINDEQETNQNLIQANLCVLVIVPASVAMIIVLMITLFLT